MFGKGRSLNLYLKNETYEMFGSRVTPVYGGAIYTKFACKMASLSDTKGAQIYPTISVCSYFSITYITRYCVRDSSIALSLMFIMG